MLTRKICILSIDGGGIRGIIPAEVLVSLEKKLRSKVKGANLIDYFDFFAGTSTGGLITCALLLPNATMKEPEHDAAFVADLYKKRGKDIFHSRISLENKFLNKLVSPLNELISYIEEKYSRHGLNAILEETFGHQELRNLLKPCLITGYNIQKRQSMLFRQHKAKTHSDYNFSVKDVCAATSAAPTYFEPFLIESSSGHESPIVDGGVVLNNPVLSAYSEVRKAVMKVTERKDIIEKDENDETHRQFMETTKTQGLAAADMFILSLGTGTKLTNYHFEQAQNWGIIEWAKPIIDIMMSGSAEIMNYVTDKMFDTLPHSDAYIRIDTDKLYEASSQMDEVSEKNIHNLEQAGKNLAEQNSDLLDSIADFLIANMETDKDVELDFSQSKKFAKKDSLLQPEVKVPKKDAPPLKEKPFAWKLPKIL